MGYTVRDLRYALRQLKKTSGLTLICVVTLALGIDANTAVFSVLNAVLLKSLPVADPDRVVYLNTSGAPERTGTIDSRETFPYTVYDALRNQHGPLSDVMAYVPLSTGKVAVRYGSQPEEAEGDMVSGSFFSGLGVKFARGRGFTEQDEANRAPIAVISFNYWNRRFAHSPDVLGKTLYVNGVPITIVGVSAKGFEGLEAGSSTDFWIPLQSRAELNAWGNPPEDGKTYIANPTWWCLRLVGRLTPGVSKAQAVAQLQPLFETAAYIGLGSPLPEEKRPTISLLEAKKFPGYDAQYGRPLRMMMTMVGFVLLIALSNVAMLLMARNATRQREFSLRLSLGAGRWELFRQLLIESLLLVSMGGVAAWLFANVATKVLGRWAQIESTLAPDHRVLGFTLMILIIATLLLGVAPLRVALAAGPGVVLKTSTATSYTDRGISRTGRTVVILQMALCVVLLLGGTLLVRTLRNLQNTPLGVRVQGLMVFGVKPQNFHTIPESIAFYQGLIQKMRVLPGVESATVAKSASGRAGPTTGS
ncbi:MAG: ABC transporter permease [Terriglobales bacterium]